MKRTLHITNGDSAVSLMQVAGILGDILPWRDVLHDGPVPMGLDLEDLSRVRADFISDCGWADRETVRQGFAERDAALRRWRDYQRITLWFEHDLYDQLQILQILDFFARQNGARDRLTIICTEQYLGYCSPDEIAGLTKYETAVSDDQLELARSAWAAFRQPDPLAWQSLLDEDTHTLPFLHGAVNRFIGEYPDYLAGLGTTEYRALEMLSAGPMPAGKMFAANQEREDRVYLGDLSYWRILGEMIETKSPLLRTSGGSLLPWPETPKSNLELTSAGRALLKGETTNPALHWPMRWFGGTCLLRPDHWRRDGITLQRVRTPKAARVDGVTIRKAVSTDVAMLRACAHAAYSHYVSAIGKPPGPMLEDYSAAIVSKEVYVAEDKKAQLLGFIVLQSQTGYLLLDNIAVNPEAQGGGIGGRLMDLAETRAKTLGLSHIELYTHEAMTDNQVIYQRRGYGEVRRVTEAGYERIYMAKPIPQSP